MTLGRGIGRNRLKCRLILIYRFIKRVLNAGHSVDEEKFTRAKSSAVSLDSLLNLRASTNRADPGDFAAGVAR